MSVRRRDSTAAIALASGALVLGIGAIALAAGPATKTVTVPAHQARTTKAKCGPDKLTLGGFRSTVNSIKLVVPNALRPSSSNAWLAGATNISARAGSLTSIAYCGTEPKVQRAMGRVNVAAFMSGTATAVCPKGTSVRYGGYSAALAPTNAGAQIIVDELKRVSERKWQVSGTNGGMARGRLTAIAECGKGVALKTATKRVSVTSAESSAVARCRVGKKVVMGGFSDAPISAAGPFIDGLQRVSGGKAWKASALSRTSTGHLTSLAYCA